MTSGYMPGFHGVRGPWMKCPTYRKLDCAQIEAEENTRLSTLVVLGWEGTLQHMRAHAWVKILS